MSHTFEIAGRAIGAGHPTYIIAELSGNHHQDLEAALKLVEAAHDAGVDAIKLQTYTPDTLTINCDREHFRIDGTLWSGRTLYDLYTEAYTPWEWHPTLLAAARELGMHAFSSPFDATAVDFLEGLQVPAYKIASFEAVDLPLLRRVAATGKPVILSLGMATLAEIDEAVRTVQAADGGQLALLKCTSAYPADPRDIHLRTIPHLSMAYGLPVGLSDHTLGIEVPIAAVALGASVIEKHLTLSRAIPGPDSAFSLEPHEFKALVSAVRTTEKALGQVSYGVSPRESASRVFRRSLFVVRDMKAGETFTSDTLRSIRPGNGLHTRYLETVLGRQAAQDIPRGTPLSWDLLAGSQEHVER